MDDSPEPPPQLTVVRGGLQPFAVGLRAVRLSTTDEEAVQKILAMPDDTVFGVYTIGVDNEMIANRRMNKWEYMDHFGLQYERPPYIAGDKPPIAHPSEKFAQIREVLYNGPEDHDSDLHLLP